VTPRTFQIAVGIGNSPEHLKNIAAVAAFIFIKRHSEAPDKIKIRSRYSTGSPAPTPAIACFHRFRIIRPCGEREASSFQRAVERPLPEATLNYG